MELRRLGCERNERGGGSLLQRTWSAIDLSPLRCNWLLIVLLSDVSVCSFMGFLKPGLAISCLGQLLVNAASAF